ncbi:hypothetical protein [Nocardiopsis sp. FR26]|uniref:hypothetical protein n=1 Tax=Nocardiopsis sp. FR26 TaxID=2605987 RepID=UPI00135A2717|nr:hypothetical protein [Nocardiopsis sp. FR26]
MPHHPDRADSAQQLIGEGDLRVDIAHRVISRLPGVTEVSPAQAAQVVAELDAYAADSHKAKNSGLGERTERLTCSVLVGAVLIVALLVVAALAAGVAWVWQAVLA